MLCMVWLVGLALNLSKYRSNFPPSVVSDSNMASKLGAGDAGGVGFYREISRNVRMESLRSRDFLL